MYSQRSACGPKLTDEQVAAIRADLRNGQEIADEYDIDKSVVSKIRNNEIHKDPSLPPKLKGFGALRTAWSAAGAAAREEFLRWLWSEHPEMVGAVMTEPRVTERQSAG